ncbi:hypothetical protein EDD11_008604 [Mortierella claussenii]|nr:hypothetical protein EDD11_008604 [Mortierella claussenii]
MPIPDLGVKFKSQEDVMSVFSFESSFYSIGSPQLGAVNSSDLKYIAKVNLAKRTRRRYQRMNDPSSDYRPLQEYTELARRLYYPNHKLFEFSNSRQMKKAS